MYGLKHTATGGLLAATGLQVGWHAFAAVTILFGAGCAAQLVRRTGSLRP